MRHKSFRVFLLLSVTLMAAVSAWAQAPAAPGAVPALGSDNTQAARAAQSSSAAHASDATKHEGEGVRSTFDAEQGTWLHKLAQGVFGQDAPVNKSENGKIEYEHVEKDFLMVALLGALGIAATWVLGARRVKIRPVGKVTSLPNMLEALLEAFQNYLISVMGRDMAIKYTPLISAFFFTILTFNYLGLVPGLVSPTANPNIPIAMALFAFFCVHIIAIKEAGVKSWFMHFVGEPIWLAPLNFPLHIIGELIKPLSLSLRLLCNVFGEEQVVVQLALMSLGVAAALHLPTFIPFQLPMLLLGTFFGFLQALVFSTLLAIYISILSTHHDDHDAENRHGHVEHVRVGGHEEIVAHPSEATLA